MSFERKIQVNREELKLAAAARRTSEAQQESAPEKRAAWHCEFCSRDFARETMFMKHRCPERERIDELRSPIGQSAYAYYGMWMKLKKRGVPTIERFGESRMYSAFLKFAEYAARTYLPTPQRFIQFMIELDVSPVLWCRDTMRAAYIEKYDEQHSPTDQVLDSIELCRELAENLEVPIERIFEELPHRTLLEHVRRRRLSPWFLLASSKFRQHLMTRSSEERRQLEDALNAGPVILRIQQMSAMFSEFSEACKEYNL